MLASVSPGVIIALMSDDEPPLPTSEHLTKQYQHMRPLIRLFGLFNRDIRRQAKELERQFTDVQRMMKDRQDFAARFGLLGWTIYDHLSVDAVRAALQEPSDTVAEQALSTHYLNADNLTSLGYRFHRDQFSAWNNLYERSVERLLSDDYLSSVPLLLIIIDGICLAKTGKHPFSGGADAPVFDTETTGPGGLATGLAILGATRRKLDTSPIDSPYRHGILHGLNPNFGNPLVAAKSVNLLHTMVDYFDRRADEELRIAKATKEQRQPSWEELTTKIAATQEVKQRIEDWVARPPIMAQELAPSGHPHSLETDSPEALAAIYLDAIVARNYGTLAKLTIDYPLRSIGYRAGRHRDSIGDLQLTNWTIVGVRDHAPAITEVEVSMTGILNETTWSGTQTMRLISNDENFEVRVRGAPDGRWTVMPNFLPNIWATAAASIRKTPSEPDNR